MILDELATWSGFVTVWNSAMCGVIFAFTLRFGAAAADRRRLCAGPGRFRHWCEVVALTLIHVGCVTNVVLAFSGTPLPGNLLINTGVAGAALLVASGRSSVFIQSLMHGAGHLKSLVL